MVRYYLYCPILALIQTLPIRHAISAGMHRKQLSSHSKRPDPEMIWTAQFWSESCICGRDLWHWMNESFSISMNVVRPICPGCYPWSSGLFLALPGTSIGLRMVADQLRGGVIRGGCTSSGSSSGVRFPRVYIPPGTWPEALERCVGALAGKPARGFGQTGEWFTLHPWIFTFCVTPAGRFTLCRTTT